MILLDQRNTPKPMRPISGPFPASLSSATILGWYLLWEGTVRVEALRAGDARDKHVMKRRMYGCYSEVDSQH